MKKMYPLLFLAMLVVFGCSEEKIKQDQFDQTEELEPLTTLEINGIINELLEKKGEFNWSDVDNFVLWSALMHGDNILSIGFYNEPFTTEKSNEQIAVKKDLIGLVIDMESDYSEETKTEEKLLVYDGRELNHMDMVVHSLETLETLRNSPNIRYLEPSGYTYFAYEDVYKSASGCNTTPSYVYPADYTTIAPGSLQSWTYSHHNIPQAWNYSTGTGITVGLIDTGISSEQSLLGNNINQGYSTGRFVQKYGTYVNSIWPWSTTTDGPDDQCGHGTLMAATIASPRNNQNLPVGVAYNCNLVAYRGTSDVVLDGYHEKRGVSQALIELANRSDVKIISMSIGHIFSAGNISDAIKYAYSKGKMIIAAGGTSTWFTNWAGVIFPASMDETIAVTGITDGAGFTECRVCHKGSKIDFTVVMQRASDSDRTSACLGYFENTSTYVGGSSVATATTAGIAALIWSQNPTWTRQQVYDKMKQSATFYPNRNSNFGWGSINALAAVQ